MPSQTIMSGLYLASLVLAVLAGAIPLGKSATTQPTVFDPKSGVTYHGNLSSKVESFLNIQYGQDTSGNARFAPPEPFSYAKGSVVNASAPGPSCPQIVVPMPGVSFGGSPSNQSEDCLRLRVDRSQGTLANASLPVMVYIYGGGDTTGTIYDKTVDPTGLVARSAEIQKPIVYVAMNYRAGIFGFAATPALNGQDSLNAGLRDQRLAMEWVQQNIRPFGGDPDNVTIFGESSGASTVGQHIVAYGGTKTPPFKRGIMESGGATSSEQFVGNLTAFHTSQVAKLLNCTSKDSSKELACLRKVPLHTLLNTTVTYALTQDKLEGFGVFQPIAPSSFLPDTPSNLLRAGRFSHNIPIMTGWNQDDGTLFIPSNVTTDADVLKSIPGFIQSVSNETISKLFALYPLSDFQPLPSENISAQFFRAAQITRDLQFTCASLLMAQSTAQYFSNTSSSASNYIFVLNQTVYAGFEASSKHLYLGVTHTSDLPYVFGTVGGYPNVTSSDFQLAKLIEGSWINFAYIGNPVNSASGQTLQNWKPGFTRATSSSGYDVSIPLRIIGGPRDGPAVIDESGSGSGTGGFSYGERQIERCNFWNSKEVLSELVL